MRNESNDAKRICIVCSALFTDPAAVIVVGLARAAFLLGFEWNFLCWDPKEGEL